LKFATNQKNVAKFRKAAQEARGKRNLGLPENYFFCLKNKAPPQSYA